LCREEAFSLANLLTQNPSLGKIKLAAVVKESLVNDDGSCETDLFREYLPRGEIYVDDTRGFYKALGQRSFFSFFSRAGLAYARQRAQGLREQGIEGNFNGALTDPLLLGGVLLVAPSGQVVWVHREGEGPVPYADLEAVLRELVPRPVGEPAKQEKSWLEGTVDGLLSLFN